MLHRIKKENDMHEGKWNGLGRKIEQGETPEECVVREVKEECGLRVIDPLLKGILTFPAFRRENEDWRVFVFTVDKFRGRLTDSREGVLQWIRDDELMNLNLWPGDRIFMKWLSREGFFSGKLIYKGGKLLRHHVIFHL